MADGLTSYVWRRLWSLLPVWLGISLLAFALGNLAPGDPVEMILLQRTGEIPTRAAVEQLREQLGLNAPAPLRYARWVAHAAQGNLGLSYRTGAPVVQALLERLPSTLQLAAASLLLSILIALPLGVAAAVRRGSWVDHMSRLIALLGTSVPAFLLGYALIMLFAVTLHLLPVAGSDGAASLVLPVLTLALAEAAALTRLTRASMLEVLGEDYVRTARAKGVPRRRVLVRHALRNALNPLVTLTGVRAGRLLGGAVIVETVFARPGIGRLVVDSIHDRDYPLIQGFVLLMGTIFLLANLAVDLSYARLDPRMRLTGGPRGDDRSR